MSYNPNNPNGQATMANSEPVVIASDQTSVPVSFTGSTDVATQTTLSAINTKLVSGTDIGDVTVNNTTANPVPVQPPASGFLNIAIDQTGNNNAVDVLTMPVTTVNNSTATNLKAEVIGTGTFAVQADTELPSASALADATANPTVPAVGAFSMSWDSLTSQWNRNASGDTSSDGEATKTVGIQEVESFPMTLNGSGTFDRVRSVVNTQNSTGTGIQAVGMIGQLDDVSPTAVTENQFAPVRISTRRALLVEGVASGTAQPMSIASGAAVSGAFADGAINTIGSRADAKSTATDTTAVSLMQVTKQISASVQAPVGTGATGSGVPASAVYESGQAKSSDITAATTGNLVGATYDLLGKQITQPYALPQQTVQGVTSAMTATTSTQVIAGVASNYIYVTQVTVGNSHASVGTMINLQDGSGGTTIYSIPANYGFGGAVITFTTPLKVPTSGNGLYAVNGTTGANTYVSAVGFKSTI